MKFVLGNKNPLLTRIPLLAMMGYKNPLLAIILGNNALDALNQGNVLAVERS